MLGVLALLVMAVAIAGVIAAAFAGWFAARNIHVEHTSNRGKERVSVSTPFGSLRVDHGAMLDLERIGIPVYPGATPDDRGQRGASVEIDLGPDSKDFMVLAATYRTSDSLSQVTSFYRKQLPEWRFHSSHRFAKMESKEDGGHRFIVMRERRGQTNIVLASLGEPASN